MTHLYSCVSVSPDVCINLQCGVSAPHSLHCCTGVSLYCCSEHWRLDFCDIFIQDHAVTFYADHKRLKNTVRCFIISSFFLETPNVSLQFYVYTCNINPLDPGLGEPDSTFCTFELQTECRADSFLITQVRKDQTETTATPGTENKQHLNIKETEISLLLPFFSRCCQCA